MNNPLSSFYTLVSILLLALFLAACSQSEASQVPTVNDPTSTPVLQVVKETVVVVVTATSPPVKPATTQTPTTVPSTLIPSPTPLQLVNVPIEGGDINNKFYAMLVYPDFNPATTTLWFRVYAHKPTNSENDGEGIATVDFTFTDSQGVQGYFQQEKNAGYCAFGGGEPDCTIWNFASHDYTWPNGTKMHTDTYKLNIVVTAIDGTVMFGETEFNIQVP